MNPGAWRFFPLAVCCAALAGAQWRAGTMVSPTSQVIAGAAQRIVIDPQTGQILQADASVPAGAVASIQQAAISSTPAVNALPRDADEVHLPDGTVGVRVARRFYHTISVCLQADGSFSSDCPAAQP